MEPITIRKALRDDLETLLRFEQGIVSAERPFDVTLRDGDDVHYYDLEALIASPDAEVVVAMSGSEIVGSGYARIESSKPYLRHRLHSYLGFMFVAPEHRGRGVNGAIMEALEAWSISRGVAELRLEVYSDNAGAIRAYEKAGFERHMIVMRKMSDSA